MALIPNYMQYTLILGEVSSIVPLQSGYITSDVISGRQECCFTVRSLHIFLINVCIIVVAEYIKFRGKLTVLQFNETEAIYTSELNDSSSQTYQEYESILLTVVRNLSSIRMFVNLLIISDS